MDRPADILSRRKRTPEQDHGSRPSTYQPSTPTLLSQPIPLNVSPTNTGSVFQDVDDSVGTTAISRQDSFGKDGGVYTSANWLEGLTTPSGAPLTDLTSDPPLPLLSDQEVHLLAFPDDPPVATGGSCELYIAIHMPTNVKIAMKRPRVDFPTEDMLRRFRREAEAWSQFKHPSILPFLGTLKIGHRTYMASPWRSLGDLLTFVQARAKFLQDVRWWQQSIPFVYSNFNEPRIISEIATGLEYLHSIGVIHGDMKAKNILLNDNCCAQICDFGLTKTLAHTVTSTELKGVGSIRWQSPELLRNAPKSPESDIYAFGMTISEVLTGNYPFPHLKEQAAIVFAVVLRNERPECQPHSFLVVDFDPLWRIAALCWEAKPEDRPRIKEVLERLTPPPTTAVHRLTPDILQHIFIFTCTSSYWDWRWPRRYYLSYKTDLAISISHVCQSWRLAATKSPSLWSDLRFNVSSPFNLQSLQIERSEGAGITIVIESDYDTQWTNQLIRLLRPHVTRWKSLKLEEGCFDKDSFRLFFDKLHHECAPMLETLHAYSEGKEPSNWEWGSQPFSRGTPRLVDLEIGHYQLCRNAGLFSYLTNLSIGWGDCAESCEAHPLCPQDLLAIFTQCASTIRSVHIAIPDCIHIEGSNPLPNPISLPHLTELNLHGDLGVDDNGRFDDDKQDDEWFILKIYSQIAAPKIQSLDLWAPVLGPLASRAAFPFPNLTCLQIHDYSAKLLVASPQLVFKHIFDQLPQLQELKLECVTYFDLRILESTCIGLQKFSWNWYQASQPALECSVIKDVIELRQLRARERGTRDSLVEVRCTLRGVKLSKEDGEWLESHLELFDFMSL